MTKSSRIERIPVEKLYMGSVPLVKVINSPQVELLHAIDRNKFDIDMIVKSKYADVYQQKNPESTEMELVKNAYDMYKLYKNALKKGLSKNYLVVDKKYKIIEGEFEAIVACAIGEEYIYGEKR